MTSGKQTSRKRFESEQEAKRGDLMASPDCPYYLDYTIRETMAIRSDQASKIPRNQIRTRSIPANPMTAPIEFDLRTDVVQRREPIRHGDFSHLLVSREDTDFDALRLGHGPVQTRQKRKGEAG